MKGLAVLCSVYGVAVALLHPAAHHVKGCVGKQRGFPTWRFKSDAHPHSPVCAFEVPTQFLLAPRPKPTVVHAGVTTPRQTE